MKDKERGRDNGAAARVLDASSGGGGGGSDGDGGSDKVRTVWCQEERSRMRAAALRGLKNRNVGLHL